MHKKHKKVLENPLNFIKKSDRLIKLLMILKWTFEKKVHFLIDVDLFFG